jgi:hypothetical protein
MCKEKFFLFIIKHNQMNNYIRQHVCLHVLVTSAVQLPVPSSQYSQTHTHWPHPEIYSATTGFYRTLYYTT